MSLVSRERVEVSVGGKDLGVFDMFSGGMTDSEEVRYKAGGMEPEESLGGQKTISNFTLQRRYKLERDHGIYLFLHEQAGVGRVEAKRIKLNADRTGFGSTHTWTGVLKSVTPPDHDSKSSDIAMLQLEVVPNAEIVSG